MSRTPRKAKLVAIERISMQLRKPTRQTIEDKRNSLIIVVRRHESSISKRMQRQIINNKLINSTVARRDSNDFFSGIEHRLPKIDLNDSLTSSASSSHSSNNSCNKLFVPRLRSRSIMSGDGGYSTPGLSPIHNRIYERRLLLDKRDAIRMKQKKAKLCQIKSRKKTKRPPSNSGHILEKILQKLEPRSSSSSNRRDDDVDYSEVDNYFSDEDH